MAIDGQMYSVPVDHPFRQHLGAHRISTEVATSADPEAMQFSPANWILDRIAQCAIGLTLLFAPLAYGATEAWSQEIVLGLIWSAAACVAVRLVLVPRRPLVWCAAQLPMVLFLALIALQLMPAPSWLIHVLSPATFHTKSALLDGLPGGRHAGGFMTLSFYPWITRQQLALVASLVVLYAVVVNVFESTDAIRRLMSVITLGGVCVAAVALYQDIARPTADYLLMVAPHAKSGPFMNHGHFAQFINLSLGAALALIAIDWVRVSRRYHSATNIFAELLQWRFWAFWVASLLCIVGPITLILSMSRGGMIAMVLSVIATAELISRQGATRSRKPVLVALGLIVLMGICCCGSDVVMARLAEMEHLSALGSTDARLLILKNLGPLVRSYPLFGAGLGSFAVVFPAFNRTPIPFFAAYAENEFAQVLTECGLVGLGLVVWFVCRVCASYLAATRQPQRSVQYAAFGIGYGLLAVFIQSFGGYGQHVMANAMLATVFCGVLISISRFSEIDGDVSGDDAPMGRNRPNWISALPHLPAPAVGAIAAALVALAGSATIFQSDHARQGEAAWSDAHRAALVLEKQNGQGSDQDYRGLIQFAASAVAAEPGNAEYRYWLSVFRWQAISRGRDVIDGHLQLSPDENRLVNRIVTDLQAIRRLCPTLASPWCIAGQIESARGDASGLRDVRTAFTLAPYNPTVCLAVGRFEVRKHQGEQSFIVFRRYIQLGGNVENLTDLFLRADMPQLAYQIAQDNRLELRHLATVLRDRGYSADLVKRCEQRSNELLEQDAGKANAPPSVSVELGELCRENGQLPRAISLYRHALAIDPDEPVWRFQLAQILAQTGEREDAVRELQLCLQVQPKMPDALILLRELTGHTED